jgi:hypothetical protein
LKMPFPNRLSLISEKRRSYENENWKVFSSRNAIEDTLYKHLVFALKYEGINLLFFKKLFQLYQKKKLQRLYKVNQLDNTAEKYGFYTNGCCRNNSLFQT